MITEVSPRYIDWITGQRQLKHKDQAWQQQRLEDLERVVRQQQKELCVFFLTVDALQQQYQPYEKLQRQFIVQLRQEHEDQDQKIQRLERRQHLNEGKIGHLEQQLLYWRTDAAERRDKKAMRQKQYHQVYFVPVINTQFKKKYMRARDQNSAVEQHLADLHRAMDGIKDRLRQDRQDWTRAHQYRQTLLERQHKARMELDRLERLLQAMKRAQMYWCEFDTKHIKPFMRILKDSMGLQLRLAAEAYETAYQDGLKRYWDHGLWDITFDCTRCHVHTEGWPCLDKASYLVCTICHQEKKTPLVILTPTMPSLRSHTLFRSYVKKLKLALDSKVDYLANHSLLLSRHITNPSLFIKYTYRL